LITSAAPDAWLSCGSCGAGIGQHSVSFAATDSDGNVTVAGRRMFVWAHC